MINEQQLKERKKYIGSSDVAALFVDSTGKSLDPFKNALDVWALKCFEQESVKTETKVKSIGHRYEDVLIEFARNELGYEIITDPPRMSFIDTEHLDKEGNPIFACNLDGFTNPKTGREIVEAKTTGRSDEWGEPGTDQVPLRAILQVQHQMLCTGFQRAHIAVLLGRFSLTEEMYLVERNEDIINEIIKRGTQFKNDYIIPRIPPPGNETGNIQIFKKIVRQPQTFAEIETSLIQEWEDAKKERIGWEKAEQENFTTLLVVLGDKEGAVLSDGRVFSYLKQRGADCIDRKLLKDKYPEVYKSVTSPNEFRVARIRNGE